MSSLSSSLLVLPVISVLEDTYIIPDLNLTFDRAACMQDAGGGQWQLYNCALYQMFTQPNAPLFLHLLCLFLLMRFHTYGWWIWWIYINNVHPILISKFQQDEGERKKERKLRISLTIKPVAQGHGKETADVARANRRFCAFPCHGGGNITGMQVGWLEEWRGKMINF